MNGSSPNKIDRKVPKSTELLRPIARKQTRLVPGNVNPGPKVDISPQHVAHFDVENREDRGDFGDKEERNDSGYFVGTDELGHDYVDQKEMFHFVLDI